MKKKIIICLIVGILSIATLLVYKHLDVKANLKNLGENRPTYSQEKSYYKDEGDGWVYVFEISYPKEKEKDRTYMFDGYNLKYKELDGYSVPVIDSSGNVLYSVSPNYITLSISEKHKSDVHMIVDYFNKYQFNNPITIEDLNELELDEISKLEVIDIFNKAITSKMKAEPGKYYNKPFIDRVSYKSKIHEVEGEWQLSYLLDFGNVSNIGIEFITDDNKYLSDLAKKDDKYNTILKLVDIVENSIVNSSNFDETIKLINESKLDSNVKVDLINLIDQFKDQLEN